MKTSDIGAGTVSTALHGTQEIPLLQVSARQVVKAGFHPELSLAWPAVWLKTLVAAKVGFRSAGQREESTRCRLKPLVDDGLSFRMLI